MILHQHPKKLDPEEKYKGYVEEGWGKNLVAGGLATAASLGGMSGAQAQQTASNEPVKQGTENVNKEQQEVFYNLMIGIAKYKDNPRSSIEAKKVYDEIINYFSALKEGKKPSELSQVAKNTVKKWYDKIKNTNNSTINALIKLGQNNKTAHIDNFNK